MAKSVVNWTAIKDEFVTTENSMRSIAQKHGVNVSTVSKKAKKENWAADRQHFQDNLQTKILEKILEERVSRVKEMLAVSDELLKEIKRVATSKELNAVEIKALTSAVKDVKEIQMIEKFGIPSPQDNQVTVELVPFEEWIG